MTEMNLSSDSFAGRRLWEGNPWQDGKIVVPRGLKSWQEKDYVEVLFETAPKPLTFDMLRTAPRRLSPYVCNCNKTFKDMVHDVLRISAKITATIFRFAALLHSSIQDGTDRRKYRWHPFRHR